MKSKSSSVALLLTATIDPGNTPLVARNDPKVRMADYEKALSFWIKSGAVDRMIFCENSGFDLTPLKALASSEASCAVDFISYAGNQSAEQRGKGYSELGVLERALRDSKQLACADIVVKCTGRLCVANAVPLLSAIARLEFDVMCDIRKNLSFADCRFFASTPAFLSDYLLPKREIVSDLGGVFFEHALARATAAAVADAKLWRPFPAYPIIEGISGTFSKTMTEGIFKRTAKTFRHRLKSRLLEP